MTTPGHQPKKDDSNGHYSVYSEYATVLRAWLVA